MRGSLTSRLKAEGISEHAIASLLGHTSVRMQDQAYATSEAIHAGNQQQAFQIPIGGKK